MNDPFPSDIERKQKMLEQETFVMYLDSGSLFKNLSHKEAGLLLRAIFDFQCHGVEPEDPATAELFLPFKEQFLKDADQHNSRSH